MSPRAARGRTLTDADIAALTDAMSDKVADKLETRLKDRFYRDVGQGVWGFAWKAIVALILVIAAYGATKGSWPFLEGTGK